MTLLIGLAISAAEASDSDDMSVLSVFIKILEAW